MRTIWKYELRITDVQSVDLPGGSTPLSVGEQNGRLVLWAVVEPEARRWPYSIRIVGTGNPFPDANECYLIGTVQMSNGLVWHVFGPLTYEVKGLIVHKAQ